MELPERAKQTILLRSRRRCECKNSSHTHPDKRFICGRELKDGHYFIPVKHPFRMAKYVKENEWASH